VLAFLSAGLTSYVYWGLGYALNPMIAIYFATEAERKGIDIDFPFLLAVTTAAQSLGNTAFRRARRCWSPAGAIF
jgi:hypothetical protein